MTALYPASTVPERRTRAGIGGRRGGHPRGAAPRPLPPDRRGSRRSESARARPSRPGKPGRLLRRDRAAPPYPPDPDGTAEQPPRTPALGREEFLTAVTSTAQARRPPGALGRRLPTGPPRAPPLSLATTLRLAVALGVPGRYGTNQCLTSSASAHRITRSARQPRASQPKPDPHLSNTSLFQSQGGALLRCRSGVQLDDGCCAPPWRALLSRCGALSARHRLRERGEQHADGQRLRDGGEAGLTATWPGAAGSRGMPLRAGSACPGQPDNRSGPRSGGPGALPPNSASDRV